MYHNVRCFILYHIGIFYSCSISLLSLNFMELNWHLVVTPSRFVIMFLKLCVCSSNPSVWQLSWKYNCVHPWLFRDFTHYVELYKSIICRIQEISQTFFPFFGPHFYRNHDFLLKISAKPSNRISGVLSKFELNRIS